MPPDTFGSLSHKENVLRRILAMNASSGVMFKIKLVFITQSDVGGQQNHCSIWLVQHCEMLKTMLFFAKETKAFLSFRKKVVLYRGGNMLNLQLHIQPQTEQKLKKF